MSFIEFARAHGVEIRDLTPSDRIRRTGTVAKPRSDNGAYLWDGRRGWVMDWSSGGQVVWYQDPNAKPLSEAEIQAWQAERNRAVQEQERRYQKAAETAAETLKECVPGTHKYLHTKGFSEERVLLLREKMIIPMYNVFTYKLQGYQAIYWDVPSKTFVKKMMPGMKAKDAVFQIGLRDAPEVWLVEGYATGLSVREALKTSGLNGLVVVCFSANNMVAVASKLQGKRFVFADNDASGTGQKAAEATGLPWTMADEEGWDANDLHQQKGLLAVIKKMFDARKSTLLDTNGRQRTRSS